jgi:arabinofuranosyltransferase
LIKHIFSLSKKQAVLVAAFLILLGVAIAWQTRFLIDDAFISFRFARNLVSGNGLVWNPGDMPVEGYTNFLWVLLMSIPIFLGKDPALFSIFLGIACFAGTLYVTFRLSSLLIESRALALLVVFILILIPSFRSFATGGLETMLQALLLTSTISIVVRCIKDHHWAVRSVLALSFLASLAVLTRIDSVVFLSVEAFVTLFLIIRSDGMFSAKLGRITAGILPFLLIIGGWFLWKLHYYGSILPNTFYVRNFSVDLIKNGINYLYAFIGLYLLLPMGVIGICSLPKLIRQKSIAILLMAAEITLWCSYIVGVGGDWMEFRFFVPILPILFILLIWLAEAIVRSAEMRIAMIGILLLAPVHYAFAFQRLTEPVDGLNSIQSLGADAGPWTHIGKILGESFQYSNQVVIATTAVGAIPYYSRLRTIDMLGLNDKWVSVHGSIVGITPGHQRLADLQYLLDEHVNLVVGLAAPSENVLQGNRYTFSDLTDLCLFMCEGQDWDLLPSGSNVIEIPLDQGNNYLGLLYLSKNTVIDQAIARNGWRVVPIVRE